MLHFYGGPTPNGQKVAIALEELGVPYEAHEIDILAGDQLSPEFLAINPNNKMPALVDDDGPDGRRVKVWESGAILVYLAEKYGRLLPRDPVARAEALQWCFFQAANQGPACGQYAHFAFYAAERIEYPTRRFLSEVQRQFRVLDLSLADREYFAGEYSIADIMLLPYTASMLPLAGVERPALRAWVERLRARPAVERGLAFMQERTRPETIARGMQGFDDSHRSILFGDEQYRER